MSYISAISRGDKVIVWERTDDGRQTHIEDGTYYFYRDDPNGKYRTIFDTPVSKVEFSTHRELVAAKKQYAAQGVKTWESDIPVELRYLSNHYYGVPAPKLHVTLFDIEVDYDPEAGVTVQDMVATNPYAPVNSIAMVHCWTKEIVVIVVPPEEGWTAEKLKIAVERAAPDAPIDADLTVRYVVCDTERELLITFLAEIEDSDLVGGWNSDFFDVPYMAQRIARVLDGEEISLATTETFTESGKPQLVYTDNPNQRISKPGAFKWLKRLDFSPHGIPSFRPVANTTNGKLMGNTLDLQGRVRLDYMNLVKKYEPGEKPSYKLAAISNDVLVDENTGEPLLPKLVYEGSLADQYENNFPFFVRYNIRDTEILYGFERKLGYVELANQMTHLSTGLFSHVNGTLKLAELALINYCHHTLKRVVKNVTDPLIDRAIDGALVLLPQVGEHHFTASIDINSLYPSAIRSLNISPETLRGQFKRDVKDAQAIASKQDVQCTLVLERGGEEVTMSALEWRDALREKKWAVSGYGTVFDQSTPGFIPALLAEWYAKRKEYQALKKKAASEGDLDKAGYYDRLQYVYKIKLNSLYGALTNLYFRFYDLRMGESTTGSGRVILKHQCRKTAEILGDGYDVEFPLYDTLAGALERGFSEEEAKQVAIVGPTFNGKHQADSVVYGDTDSTYFKTYASSVEEAIAIADRVAALVNESYPEFMRETFLCNPGYDTLIKAGREIVSDRGIFVEKKRYILHVVDVEGTRTDKMKVMGLDTKKTTLPVEVSDRLNGFIERYLKGEPWEDVSRSIVQYKEELTNSTDIMAIGLPKGVKNLEDYTYRYKADPTTGLPGHVAASIHYNQCLKEYNDKLSLPISSGMKVKVFYLSTKAGRFKSIAIPTDIEIVPAWFTENFTIDIQAHIERLVDNPLSNILKAIGKRPPSKQSLIFDELVVF